MYYNVRKGPHVRLRVDHVATYCQKNAQQIWMCASYTFNVSFPTPPHTPIMCIVSYIQSSAIWHTEIAFTELSSFHEFLFLFCFALFCFKYVLFIVMRIHTPFLPCLSSHKIHFQPSKILWSMCIFLQSLHQSGGEYRLMKIDFFLILHNIVLMQYFKILFVGQCWNCDWYS